MVLLLCSCSWSVWYLLQYWLSYFVDLAFYFSLFYDFYHIAFIVAHYYNSMGTVLYISTHTHTHTLKLLSVDALQVTGKMPEEIFRASSPKSGFALPSRWHISYDLSNNWSVREGVHLVENLIKYRIKLISFVGNEIVFGSHHVYNILPCNWERVVACWILHFKLTYLSMCFTERETSTVSYIIIIFRN